MQATPLAIAALATGPSAKPSATRGSEPDEASGLFAQVLSVASEQTVTDEPSTRNEAKLPLKSAEEQCGVEALGQSLAPKSASSSDPDLGEPTQGLQLSDWLADLLVDLAPAQTSNPKVAAAAKLRDAATDSTGGSTEIPAPASPDTAAGSTEISALASPLAAVIDHTAEEISGSKQHVVAGTVAVAQLIYTEKTPLRSSHSRDLKGDRDADLKPLEDASEGAEVQLDRDRAMAPEFAISASSGLSGNSTPEIPVLVADPSLLALLSPERHVEVNPAVQAQGALVGKHHDRDRSFTAELKTSPKQARSLDLRAPEAKATAPRELSQVEPVSTLEPTSGLLPGSHADVRDVRTTLAQKSTPQESVAPALTPPPARPASQEVLPASFMSAPTALQAPTGRESIAFHPSASYFKAEAFVQPDIHSPSFAPAFSARVATMVHGGIESARVHLNPVEMGPVSVQMSLEGQQVRVDMTASLAATRMALEQALPSLAGALREAGFTLNGGGVHQPASDGRSQNFGDTGAQGNPQGSAAGSAFGQSAGTPGRQGDPSQPSPQSPQRQDAFSGVVTVGGDASDTSTRVASLQSHRTGTRLVDVFA